jgi:transcriptional regulator with XRE-family HTH domain
MGDVDIGELIEELFRTHRKADGKEYTNKEVCEALDILPSHLSRLRSGKIANPGRDVLVLLCRFFKVPPSYFFPELQQDQEYMNSQLGDDVELLRRSYSLEVEQRIEELLKIIKSHK